MHMGCLISSTATVGILERRAGGCGSVRSPDSAITPVVRSSLYAVFEARSAGWVA